MSAKRRNFRGLPIRSVDVPDDVRAELDAEERRMRAEAILATPHVEVPEDVLSERDQEERLGDEEVRQRLTEGRPPAEDDPRV